jgi:hypothetical protein
MATEGIYRRLSVRMYGDEKFMRLTPLLPSGQALWIYLLTGPHTGPIPGVFVIGRAALAEALNWEDEDFAKAFQEVLGEGLIEFDGKTRMWFIPKAIHHNPPPNPNVVKSWRSHWQLLPECSLRDRIFDHLSASLSEVSPAFAKALDDACSKTPGKPSDKALPNGMAKQETGSRKQEQEEKRPSVSSARPTVPCPYEAIVALYHEKLPTLPSVKLMQPARQKALRKLWAWVLSSTKSSGERRAMNSEEALAWIGDYFSRAAENDFLMGRGDRSGPHANWRCDMDFLLTDRGMRHVIEKTAVAA